MIHCWNKSHSVQVKPDATDEEVKAAIDSGADQIFTEAVRTLHALLFAA